MGYNSLKQMKKSIFMVLPLALAIAFIGCTKNDTPTTTSTKLWPAYNSISNLYGYINNSGEWAIPAQFSTASSFFSAGYALVTINGIQAFIDTDGEVQSCVSFDQAEAFYYGYARASLNNGVGLINTKFEFAIQPVYAGISRMTSDGLVTYPASGDKVGFLDKKGNVLMKDGTPLFYEEADSFRDGYCVVCSNMSTENDRIPTYALIDTKGNIVIAEGSYKEMWNMGLGIVATIDRNTEAGKTEFTIRKADGNQAIGTRMYDGVGRYSVDEVAVVGVVQDGKDKYGYIDKDGREVISVTYDQAYNSTDGYAWVLDDKTCKLLDVKNGTAAYTCQAMTSDVQEYPLCGVHNGLTLIIKVTNYNGDQSAEYRWVDVSSNRTVYSWSYNKDKQNGDLDPATWAPGKKNKEEFSEYVFLK